MKKIIPVILGATMLSVFISCGGDSDNNSSNPQQEQANEGVYQATLSALNAEISGNPSGVADIIVSGDTFTVSVAMNGVPVNITHVQHIHTGSACPTTSADVNGDGYVDVLEGVPTYGPILIPLDGDLSSQGAGANGFPMADAAGLYAYTQSNSLSAMLEDLRAPDADPTDAVVKLGANEELNLDGRHVVIHGVPTDTNLPDTVGTIPGVPAQASLPIACGVLTRVVGSDTTPTIP